MVLRMSSIVACRSSTVRFKRAATSGERARAMVPCRSIPAARRGFRSALAAHLGMPADPIVVADDEKTHTAALAAALDRALNHLPIGAGVMLVAAAAGITAGAALYREPPIPNWAPQRE